MSIPIPMPIPRNWDMVPFNAEFETLIAGLLVAATKIDPLAYVDWKALNCATICWAGQEKLVNGMFRGEIKHFGFTFAQALGIEPMTRAQVLISRDDQVQILISARDTGKSVV